MTGTWELLRLVLRRDRIRLAIWVAAIVSLVAISAGSVVGLYDTAESLAGYADIVRDNATMIVQSGPGYGLDDPTVGAVLMNELSMWTVIAVALMSIFMVTRHTRTEEETGRSELVRAAPVGRHATAAAAMSGVLVANLAVATGVAVAIVAFGLPVVGAVAFGAALVGAGMVFAGIALVAGQVAASARAASGSAAAVLGAAFALRAVGDVGDGRLSWLSPIGWAQAVRPFADERWWVLALPGLASAGSVFVADVLTSRRDLGAGLVPPRAGRAAATPLLSTTLGLAVRLHRGTLIGWTVGLAAIGFFYGLVAVEAESILADNPELTDFFAQFGEGSLTDAFLATAVLMLGLLGGGYTVSAVLRLRGEETDGRVDALLATPVSRPHWMLGHLGVAVVGSVIVMLGGSVAMGLGFAMASGEAGQVGRLTGAGLAMVPAMAVLGAVAAAVVGWWPRWALVAWGAVAVTVVIGLLAELLGLPAWTRDISPFSFVPAMPVDGFEPLPLAMLSLMAVGLAAIGVIGLRRRDLA